MEVTVPPPVCGSDGARLSCAWWGEAADSVGRGLASLSATESHPPDSDGRALRLADATLPRAVTPTPTRATARAPLRVRDASPARAAA